MALPRIISTGKIYEAGKAIKQYLFHNDKWTLDYKSMIVLFNYISKDPSAPNPHNIPYGSAIDATNNARCLLFEVGVKGSYHKLQAKQAITCALMKFDTEGTLVPLNKKLLNVILPHKNDNCRDKWISQCEGYLKDYRAGKSDAIFNKYEHLTRDS